VAEDLDQVTRDALRLLYEQEQAATRRFGPPCPSCGRRTLRPDEDLCSTCQGERRERELEGKRRWQRSRSRRGATPRQGAATWLKQELRRGPLPSNEVKRRAREAGYELATLQRARTDVEIAHWREGQGRDHRTWWSLPQHVPEHVTRRSETRGETSDEDALEPGGGA
jgi:hypothetical protein